jgi:predicted amino acid-binding ACT domain protein
MYKGHPQPAVDERLFASKNFLADEDPNRCLDFDSRIDQIEGYVAHIENVALPCDPGLFRDVKVMLEVHRDWEARTRDRPPDTSCCYAPAILPFSTRLISAETGTNLEVGWEATGIATQMRHNHAPFTIQRDINSAEFWRELHKDSSTHPSLVPERNLLWEERRAYGWALADPAIISYWMHPTKGIMKTGVRMIDPLQWYQKPREQTVVRNRPARGWIPSYALERGDKINRLLGKKDTTPEEWQELKALLCDFEPENIHQLHLDLVGYHDALEIIGLSEEQKATMEQTETQFKDEYHDWIETFKNDGVFFIVATATQRPIDQPGVFYIVDGILAQAHRNILNAAQTLLEKMFSIGRENMEIEETDSLDSLLSHTLPTHIKHLENKNANILRNAGVSSWRELSEDAQATSNTLYHKTQLLRREWENQLKSLSAEFRYLRPSELVRDDPKLLYLPWDLLTVPVVEHRIVPERSLPQSADRLQSDINASLQVHPVDETELDLNSELDISNSESGAPSLVEMLFQVAYPELRRLLIPYISLLRLPITGFEKSVLELIKEETKRLYYLWLLGLGDKITIKLPRPEQQPENPGVLYCNLPYQDSDKGQQAAYDHIAERINQLLTKKESKGYWNKMEALFKDLQYPELRGIFDNMQKQRKTPGGAKLREVWNTMFRRWIRSLRGTRVRVQRSRTSFDPDEDPSVVYYCDQFLDEQDPPISTSTRDTISGYWDPEDHEAAELEDFVEKFEDLLPEKVLNALKHWERSRTDHDKGLFRWRFLCWFNNSRRPSTFVYKRQGTSSTPVLGDIDGEFTKVLSTKNGYSNWQSGNEGDDVTSQQVYEVGVQMLRPRKPEEMESAINHVLKKLKNLCFEEPYLDSQPERWLSIWERICQLMTPFFPDTVWDLYKQIETLNGELEDNAKDDRRTLGSQVMELHSLSSYYCEELRVWMFELLGDLPVRIAKPGERIKPSLLYFQPESQKFDIRYPMVVPQNIYHASTWNYDELIYTASSDKTTPLASRAATPRIMEAAHREQCIHDLEGLINAQLEIRGKRTLDWRESEKLRSYLRLVMPSELFALDEELRGLDAKARSPNEILSPDERLNFWTLWDLWKREYKKWIDEFPDGITIHNGSGASHDPKVLELMQEPPWNLEEFILPENSALPTPVKENEELLEHYLSTPNSLETDQARDMDYLLRSLWRCTGVQFRRIFRHRLEQYIFGEDMSNSPPDEEENVLIEAALAHACGMFVTKLKKTPGSRVRIREDVPGNYHLCEDTPTPLDHTNKEAQVQWSESNVKVQLNPAHLQPKEEFFALARLIRHTETSKLDEEELSRILPHLALTAPVEIMAIDDIIIQLLVKEQTSGLSCIESEALMLADYQQLWLRWGQMFPELRVRVISYSSITNAVRQPGTRLVPGSKCQDTCSTTRLPNPFEVRELEIEINNLMTREISGTISHEQQRELEFILPVLLPHHLRLLNSRIKALESDFVNQPSIGISHIMELNEVLRQRFDSLSAWKRDFLSEGGIFLNPRLYNKSQVTQACSRAKEWRDSVRRKDGTVDWPATDTDFEDPTVKDLHHMRDTLIEYLESGACGNIGMEEKLLFRFMCPLSMTSILDQIKTQQYDLGTGVEDPRNDMTLQFRKQIFITRYMRWLQSLSVRFHSDLESHRELIQSFSKNS